jgi:hypothetical protein
MLTALLKCQCYANKYNAKNLLRSFTKMLTCQAVGVTASERVVALSVMLTAVTTQASNGDNDMTLQCRQIVTGNSEKSNKNRANPVNKT